MKALFYKVCVLFFELWNNQSKTHTGMDMISSMAGGAIEKMIESAQENLDGLVEEAWEMMAG